jgi:hypothetical protein
MAEQIFDPIPISYRGLIADSHLVDAQQFGRSIIGFSKLANSICHELLFDQVTHDPRSYHVRFCVLPSRENGLLQEIVGVLMSGMPLFPPIAMQIGKVFVEQMIKAMVSSVLHKSSDTSKALDVIAQRGEQDCLRGIARTRLNLKHPVKLLKKVGHSVRPALLS